MASEPRSFPKIELRTTPERGRGVFAVEPIEEGEVIEDCPVIVVPEEQVPTLMTTKLSEYAFRWGGTGDACAIALGYGSLYNHSNAPSAVYVRKPTLGIISFVAIRAIAEGEEITVSYHGGFGERGPVWFEIK